jgi:hypothetical protein
MKVLDYFRWDWRCKDSIARIDQLIPFASSLGTWTLSLLWLDCGLDDRGVGVRSPTGKRDFPVPQNIESLWCPPNYLSNGHWSIFTQHKAFCVHGWHLGPHMLSYVVCTVTFTFALILSSLKAPTYASSHGILVFTHQSLVVTRYTARFSSKTLHSAYRIYTFI